MMQEIYDDCTIHKKKMLQAKQDYENTKDPNISNTLVVTTIFEWIRKISLNSGFMIAISNHYFRYYDLAIAGVLQRWSVIYSLD